MKTILLIPFLIMLNITGFTQEVNSCYTEISCDACNLMVETENPIILDVRLYRAYKKERINGAQSASNKKSLNILLDNVDKNATILVYCKEGIRSQTVAKIICKELKFNNVYSLKKGFSRWKKKGYPTDNKSLNNN